MASRHWPTPEARGREGGSGGRALADVASSALRLFEDAPFAALLCDAELALLSVNHAAEALFGWPRHEVAGRDLCALLFSERDREAVRAELEAGLARGRTEPTLRISATRSGEARLHEWTLVPLRDRAGRVDAVAVLVREVLAAHERHAAAVQAAGDAVWDWDLATDRLWLSSGWAAIAGGAGEGDAPGQWLDRVHPSDREPLQDALRAHLDAASPRFECEHRLRHVDGGFRWILARGRAVRDGGGTPIRLCGTMTDVSARRAASDRVLHDALHDPLTRLPNPVLFLDLDHFKSVNDGLGHAAGDELLLQMSRRLLLCLREGDTLARQGGDEFTILLDDVQEAADAHHVADRIHQATAQPFEISGNEVFATCSIGIALSAPTYARPEDLLLDADTAMYRAKAVGRARSAVFDAATRERSPQLLHLEADLRRALLRAEFRVQYLPIFDLATGAVLALEALLRWAHPRRGLLPPAQFVPLAEETGLIVPMGRALLARAGRELEGCRRVPGHARLRLHVNLSSKELLDSDLLQQVDALCRESALAPDDLTLELTEQTLQQGDPATARVAELRQRGVRLCVDGFGTGSSSLSSLHRFPLDSLKIDQSLFAGGAPRGQAPELVRTIVALAREIGTPVVAEGIETAEQVGFLRELGCTAAQGFFFSPPLDVEEARALLARAPAHPVAW